MMKFEAQSATLRSAQRAIVCAIALSAFVLAPGADADDLGAGGAQEIADESPTNSAALPGGVCSGGFAGGFACRNVELLAWLGRSAIGQGQLNDVWGWTDPRSGSEYAILGLRNGTAFVDLSDPRDPIQVGFLPSRTSPSIWRDMKVYGDYAFIVSEAAGHGMQVFDLGELANAGAPATTFSAAATYGGFGRAHNLAINEATGFAFAVGSDTCAGGLHIVDIAEPLNPAFAGCFGEDGYTHDTQCVVYTGPDADHFESQICFNANEDTLTIVDVSDPASPIQVSRTSYAGRRYTHQGWLTEDQAYFLIGDELDERRAGTPSRTYVLDVSDLDAPFLTGVHTGTTPAIDHNQYVVGDHVFQANYRGGLRILRLGDLAEAGLAEVAFFDTYPLSDHPSFSGAWGVFPFFDSGIVVISDINRGLFVVRPDLGAVPRCDDGLDNDHDGFVDYPEDPACLGPEGDTESPRNDVVIDIRPGSDRNPVNPGGHGVIPVALFGDDGFDVDDVDAATLRFGPGAASPAHHQGVHGEDLDGDGFGDLVAHFRTQETGIADDALAACLEFELRDGTPYASCDIVEIVPGCGMGFESSLILPPLATWCRRRRGSRAPRTSRPRRA